MKKIDNNNLLLYGIILRVIFLIYGEWQDENMIVKYTDIDYQVYNDGAQLITYGKIPFDRDTYRYTPYLALILLPNIYIHKIYGKILFAIFDIFVAIMISKIISSKQYIHICWWLFNPFVFAVSTRGSADVIIVFLVLLTIYNLGHTQWYYAGIIYGIAIHMKLYPIIYAPSIIYYIHLCEHDYNCKSSKNQFIFGSIISFFILTITAYIWCGNIYIEEAFLYHIYRKDHRHNFSIYFLQVYLEDNNILLLNKWLPIIAFIPQILLILLISWKLAHNLPLCLTILTLIFVTFNKVITAQYFLWYWGLLPLIIPTLTKVWKKSTGIFIIMIWWLAEINWLYWAYTFEFQGKNNLFRIWMASVVFYLVNILIIAKIINSYPNHLKIIIWKCGIKSD